MRVAGIDFSTKAAEIVLVSVDDFAPLWTHVAFSHGDALERARAIPHAMPPSGWWEDMGVIHVAIEDPHIHVKRTGTEAVFRAQGAILACVPMSVGVWLLPPHEWRRELGLRSGKRVVVKAAARAFALEHGAPDDFSEDACDAYCIGTAALRMLERASVHEQETEE